MFVSHTSPKRQRVNTLRLIHSLALRACILNGSREHGAAPLELVRKSLPAVADLLTARSEVSRLRLQQQLLFLSPTELVPETIPYVVLPEVPAAAILRRSTS